MPVELQAKELVTVLSDGVTIGRPKITRATSTPKASVHTHETHNGAITISRPRPQPRATPAQDLDRR